MKIAVCISGQPRSIRAGHEYLYRNLLSRYSGIDIFIHTWEDESCLLPYDLYDLYGDHQIISGYQTKGDAERYNQTYTNTPDPVKFPASNSVYMFYSIYETCKLLREAETYVGAYDWVVKTRFDYALNIPIEFEKLDPNKVYVPNCRMTPARNFCNDQFAFGSSHIMKKYMSTYMHMDWYYSLGVPMNGEAMLSANLQYHGLVGDSLEYVDMKNPFPPGLYNGTWHSLIRDDMDKWKSV